MQVREIKNLKSPIKLKIINIELNKVSNKIKKYQEKITRHIQENLHILAICQIGTLRRLLAVNLMIWHFHYIIISSKNTWVKARNIIGYKKNRLENLIVKFGGRPYVNINLSLNSFLPKGLLKKSYDKIVDHWLLKLKLEPYNHDKIEFNIATTCYDFTIKDR